MVLCDVVVCSDRTESERVRRGRTVDGWKVRRVLVTPLSVAQTGESRLSTTLDDTRPLDHPPTLHTLLDLHPCLDRHKQPTALSTSTTSLAISTTPLSIGTDPAMAKVAAEGLPWLSKPSTGYDLFTKPAQTPIPTDLAAEIAPKRLIATRGSELFVGRGNEVRCGDLQDLKARHPHIAVSAEAAKEVGHREHKVRSTQQRTRISSDAPTRS